MLDWQRRLSNEESLHWFCKWEILTLKNVFRIKATDQYENEKCGEEKMSLQAKNNIHTFVLS